MPVTTAVAKSQFSDILLEPVFELPGLPLLETESQTRGASRAGLEGVPGWLPGGRAVCMCEWPVAGSRHKQPLQQTEKVTAPKVVRPQSGPWPPVPIATAGHPVKRPISHSPLRNFSSVVPNLYCLVIMDWIQLAFLLVKKEVKYYFNNTQRRLCCRSQDLFVGKAMSDGVSNKEQNWVRLWNSQLA